MTVRSFLIGATVAFAVSIGIWLAIIYLLNPDQAGFLGHTAFFLTLFLALASLVSIIGFGIRSMLQAEQLPAYRVRVALRQGIVLSSFFCILLLLQLAHLYRWWLALLLIGLCVFIELIFLSYDRSLIQRAQRANTPRHE